MEAIKLRKGLCHATLARGSALLVILALMRSMTLPPVQAAIPNQEITDSDITYAVEDALVRDKGVFPNNVDVSTADRVVTLSGSVDNLLAKDRAVKIAESIRGVLGVISSLKVQPVPRPDEDIRKDILTALLRDPATESYQVAVSVHDAAATLAGGVGSYAEKHLAERLAEGVKGVTAVYNNLSINYLAPRTDQEIAADINARLQWDIWVNGGLINATAKKGAVTLTGSVTSAISKSRAFDDAWVNGVISVDDSGLKVDANARRDASRNIAYATRTDSEIKQAVQAALNRDPRVSAFSPTVLVTNGEVILTGVVGNVKAKTNAGQDARNITGVWRVDNFLKVQARPGNCRTRKWKSN